MMRTITFYSYKGGVGRSLLVANLAKYLAAAEKRVFAIDLDLEAPGLNYKFALDDPRPSVSTLGVVDLVDRFIETKAFPVTLAEYVASSTILQTGKTISIMRAGRAPTPAYWQRLTSIDWFSFFYKKGGQGVEFVLELQRRIQDEFSPDYLLVDARTGLTEISAAATTLLPDTVVCIALASREHLEGLRELMLGIKRSRSGNETSVKLVPVISRFPKMKDTPEEANQLSEILAFLNTPSESDSVALELEEVVTLHSEPLLETQEQLLVGSRHSPYDVALLRDYLMLFSRIIPADDLRPHFGEMVQSAVDKVLDDPNAAQTALEALTTYSADPGAYRALIKLYQLRNQSIDKIVATAAMMWQLCMRNSDPDPLLVDIVDAAYSESRFTGAQRKYVEFAEAVWRADGKRNARVARTLAELFGMDDPDRAILLLREYIGASSEPYWAVTRLLELLRSCERFDEGLVLVEQFKTAIADADFQTNWTNLIVSRGDADAARGLLQDPAYMQELVRRRDPSLFYRLLKLTGKDAPESLLAEAMEEAVAKSDKNRLKKLGEIYLREGRSDEFENILSARAPSRLVAEVLGRLRRSPRIPTWRD